MKRITALLATAAAVLTLSVGTAAAAKPPVTDPWTLDVTVYADQSHISWLVVQGDTWNGGSYSSGKWARIESRLVLDVSCDGLPPYSQQWGLLSPIVTVYAPGCTGTLYDSRDGTVYATATVA